MSTSFSLPLECLELIIRQLQAQNDLNSLFNLLLVNKYACSATIPILYDSPLLVNLLKRYVRKDSPLFARHLSLITTLLLSVPKTHMTDLLHAAFPQVPAHQECYPAPYAPYHSFLTSVRAQYFYNLFQGKLFDNKNPPSPELVDYVLQNGLENRYFAETPFARLIGDWSWDDCHAALTQDIRRDLTWALCSNPERIKSLVIPISDIGRFLTLVGRFQALSDVTFALDRQLHDDDVNLDDLTFKERTVLNIQLEERTRHLDQMILFVQELQQQHNGFLRTASCPPVRYLDEECPGEYETKLLCLLPPLIDPQHIDVYNWSIFAAKVKETNLSLVKSIKPHMSRRGAMSLARILEQTPFLHRCRSLESIEGTSIAEDVFQWAVGERKQHNTDIAAGRLPQQPLVPLKTVDISNYRPFDGRLINDIGFAFGNTLTSLSLLSFAQEEAPDNLFVSTDCLVGSHHSSSSWNAPRLSNLTIETNNNFLRVRPGLLAECPQLTTITLEDRRQEYSPGDIVQFQPAGLRRLKSLRLKGSPAISFHPDTLRTTRKLQYLNVTMVETNGFTYIPPAVEQDELEYASENLSSTETATTPSPSGRSIWTWDWKLPILTHLVLNAEFAYGFQFKILQGTPNLSRLLVNMKSTSGQHKRTVGVKDFLRTTQGSMATTGEEEGDNDDEDDESDEIYITELIMDSEILLNIPPCSLDDVLIQPVAKHKATISVKEHLAVRSEYINLPMLKTLVLKGSWTMNREVLEILCKVAPEVTFLSLEGCNGFGLVDLVQTTSMLLQGLEQTQASVVVTPDLLSEAGLVEVESSEGESRRFHFAKSPLGSPEDERGLCYKIYT
ncbi:MAG: hypothetical protein JOS17DRAFT_804601 [Linnemannia elongata]|nr:MAG: hypothetical protein JOS17DRAFT_804601 [Linnemannia elongata]